MMSARVELFMDLAQVRVGDVCVDLGRADRSVTEELLDRTDVGAIVQKVGGEDMPQNVRGHFLRNACFCRVAFDDPLDRARSETCRNIFADRHIHKKRFTHILARL